MSSKTFKEMEEIDVSELDAEDLERIAECQNYDNLISYERVINEFKNKLVEFRSSFDQPVSGEQLAEKISIMVNKKGFLYNDPIYVICNQLGGEYGFKYDILTIEDYVVKELIKTRGEKTPDDLFMTYDEWYNEGPKKVEKIVNNINEFVEKQLSKLKDYNVDVDLEDIYNDYDYQIPIKFNDNKEAEKIYKSLLPIARQHQEGCDLVLDGDTENAYEITVDSLYHNYEDYEEVLDSAIDKLSKDEIQNIKNIFQDLKLFPEEIEEIINTDSFQYELSVDPDSVNKMCSVLGIDRKKSKIY